MTSTSASLSEPTFGRKIRNMDRDIKRLYRMISTAKTVETIQAGGLNLPTSSPSDDVSNFVHIAGEQMTGPLGFEPSLVTIGDGFFDIGNETNNFKGRIIVSPETGATDNLYAMLNPQYNGQLLFLQGVQTDTITIYDATSSGTGWATSTGYSASNVVSNGGVLYVCHTGHTSSASDEPGVGANWEDYWHAANIETIDGNAFTLADDDIIIFQYDSTDNRWQQVTTGKQNLTATEIADGDTKVVVNDSTPDIQMQVNGVTLAAWNVDGSGDERLLFSGAYLDLNGVTFAGVDIINPDAGLIRPVDETVIKAFSGYIGISVDAQTPVITDSTNVGALKIPYVEDTDDSPTATKLNNWFGNLNGCIGIQYDNDTPDVYTLWVKANSGWHYVTLT